MNDTEMLDWLQKDGGACVFSVATQWYCRAGYGKPHTRCSSLREAILRAARKT